MRFKHIENVDGASLNEEYAVEDAVSVQEFSSALFSDSQSTTQYTTQYEDESMSDTSLNDSDIQHEINLALDSTSPNFQEHPNNEYDELEALVDSIGNTISRSDKIVGTSLADSRSYEYTKIRSNASTNPRKKIIGKGTVSVNPTKICVMGVGGAGVNAANMMVQQDIQGVEIIAANTDAQTLNSSLVDIILPMGNSVSGGLGVGGDPLKGAEAAREARKDIYELIKGYDMLFLAAGMGGGTGTGATPYIAEIAKELGVLTVGVITLPFTFEGPQKISIAQEGLKDLETVLDSLIVIPNDNIAQNDFATGEFGVLDGFKVVDSVLANTVRSITEIITKHSLINIDFADIKNCLSSAGRVAVGFGYADSMEGKHNNAHSAVETAFKNTVISQENLDIMQNANHIIANTVAGSEVSFNEYTAISDMIASRVNSSGRDYLFKHGYRVDKTWGKKVQITIIASNKANLEHNSRFSQSHTQHLKHTQATSHALRSPQDKVHESVYAMRNEHNVAYSEYSNDGSRDPVRIDSDYVKNNNFEQLLENRNFDLGEEDILEHELNNERYNTPALNRLLGLNEPARTESVQSLEKVHSD